jgi:hypothetical protein
MACVETFCPGGKTSGFAYVTATINVFALCKETENQPEGAG